MSDSNKNPKIPPPEDCKEIKSGEIAKAENVLIKHWIIFPVRRILMIY
ncbi:MAG: hypothetical protein M3405_03135 [Acidobacteriota bacterium]|nr:hypothetical protein [Acidobacteriota bacterium]